MQELWFLHSACPLMLADIYMKFHDASLYGLKVTERTRWRQDFVRDKVQREITKNINARVTVSYRSYTLHVVKCWLIFV